MVNNGLRAGWMDLGHTDSEVMALLGQLPGQPLALRTANGEDNALEPIKPEVDDVETVITPA